MACGWERRGGCKLVPKSYVRRDYEEEAQLAAAHGGGTRIAPWVLCPDCYAPQEWWWPSGKTICTLHDDEDDDDLENYSGY